MKEWFEESDSQDRRRESEKRRGDQATRQQRKFNPVMANHGTFGIPRLFHDEVDLYSSCLVLFFFSFLLCDNWCGWNLLYIYLISEKFDKLKRPIRALMQDGTTGKRISSPQGFDHRCPDHPITGPSNKIINTWRYIWSWPYLSIVENKVVLTWIFF